MQEQSIVEQIAQGLAYGEYSLLLGAGASLGAVGGNGRTLPLSSGLRDTLVDEFEIDTEGETLSLSQIYGYLQFHNRRRANSLLKKWFSSCRPSWQHLLAEFSWKRIWTLNIDDVVETSFRGIGRPLKSLTWNERFSARDFLSEQQIIHLHGMAERISDEGDNDGVLVFSLSEYAQEVANPRTWHKVFHDELATKPFLIIGAQLVEEFDLIDALERGSISRASSGFPSVLVVPNISQFRKTQLESYGFVVVQSDGESFIRELVARYRDAASALGELYAPTTPGLSKFLQQFIDLRTFQPHDLHSEDFFSGYQPTWNTIVSQQDAVFDKTNEASDKIVRLATSEETFQEIVFLTGNPGSGKSTGLLRIGANLMGAGIRPFWFRADEYLDVDSTVEWLKTIPRSVLLFDDFSDHSTTLQDLADRCRDDGIRMLLVAADRATRIPMVRDRINEQYLDVSTAYWYGKLSDADIDRILDKLHSYGRLGRITRRHRNYQREYFVKAAERSLFDAMSDLEGARGFRERVTTIYQALPSDGLRNLYSAACLCYDHAVGLPTGIAADFAGVPPRDLANLIEDQCRGILVLTRAGIRPPHRMTASLVVRMIQPGARVEASLALARALAPHIDDRAMRTGTREYQIVRHLMNHETVLRVAGEQEGRNWYESLRNYYDWNGRYWDQRALFESRCEQHETARSYAERSIQVHPHSFGHNTLGTVLLRMAIRQGSVELLRQGINHLTEANEFRGWGVREHPFVTFFTSMNRYAQEWGIVQIPQPLRNSWTDWYKEAQSSTVFSTIKGREDLSNWQRQWIQLAAAE